LQQSQKVSSISVSAESAEPAKSDESAKNRISKIRKPAKSEEPAKSMKVRGGTNISDIFFLPLLIFSQNESGNIANSCHFLLSTVDFAKAVLLL